MNKKGRMWRGAATGLAAGSVLLGFAAVASAHQDVILRNAAGDPITALDDPATVNIIENAYSPKMTCMSQEAAGMSHACHARHLQTDANLDGQPDRYASAGIHDVHKTQGVLDADGSIYWQSYINKAYDHGTVKGRHMQEGRNEDYSIEMKTVFEDAYFTSSPGMYGKF